MVSPTVFPQLTGNAVSAHRISEGLKKGGHEVRLITPSDEVGDFKPDVVHALHAFKSARAQMLANKFRVPLVLTMTGTDGNRDIHDPQKRLVIAEMLFQAAAVTFYSDILKAKVVAEFPKLAEKTVTVTKGFPLLPESSWKMRQELKLAEQDIIFSLVGSIRPVKDSLFPLKPLERLHTQNPHAHLVVAGEIIEDPDYGKRFQDAIANKSWIHALGSVPRDKVRQVFLESDVIVNCSLSESESNTLIEAMLLGKTVLASDIDANASLVGTAGVLYRAGDEEEFYQNAKMLAQGPRDAFGDRAKHAILRKLNPLEAEDYARVYEHAIGAYLER